MKTGADAFGRALVDWVRGGTEPEIYERDDGFVDVGAGPELFLAEFRRWPSSERQAMRYVRGRVLDVGCGAGQSGSAPSAARKWTSSGWTPRPLAARASRQRGVRKVWCSSMARVTRDIGSFDTVVLFGNNFGIFGSPDQVRTVLSDWAARMPPGARILAESINPYLGGAPAMDRSYYLRNKERGLMPGECRLRVRYRDWATPWFRWLFVSRTEMRALLRGTGWHQSRILGTAPLEPYVSILEKD